MVILGQEEDYCRCTFYPLRENQFKNSQQIHTTSKLYNINWYDIFSKLLLYEKIMTFLKNLEESMKPQIVAQIALVIHKKYILCYLCCSCYGQTSI